MERKGTDSKIAKIASRVMGDPRSSKDVRSIAASALTQANNPAEVTSAKVAKIASKILRDNRFGKDAKSLAASVMGQRD